MNDDLNKALKEIVGDSVRINIRVGDTVRGIFFTANKEPQNRQEWIELLEEVVSGLKNANDIPPESDPEVLGVYSPEVTSKKD